jgi:hypothetical protein
MGAGRFLGPPGIYRSPCARRPCDTCRATRTLLAKLLGEAHAARVLAEEATVRPYSAAASSLLDLVIGIEEQLANAVSEKPTAGRMGL